MNSLKPRGQLLLVKQIIHSAPITSKLLKTNREHWETLIWRECENSLPSQNEDAEDDKRLPIIYLFRLYFCLVQRHLISTFIPLLSSVIAFYYVLEHCSAVSYGFSGSSLS